MYVDKRPHRHASSQRLTHVVLSPLILVQPVTFQLFLLPTEINQYHPACDANTAISSSNWGRLQTWRMELLQSSSFFSSTDIA